MLIVYITNITRQLLSTKDLEIFNLSVFLILIGWRILILIGPFLYLLYLYLPLKQA